MNVMVHSAVKARLESVALHPGGTVLLHGAQSVGKWALALDVARRLNCEGCSDQTCRSCRMANGGNHPNILIVEPNEKGKIAIETVQELQHNLVYEQYEVKGQRIVLMRDVDTATLPAQNALLKMLEEPPVGTTMILTATSASALLPTVLSRCMQLFVPPLEQSVIATYLQEALGLATDQSETIAALSHGALGLAITYSQDDERYRQDQIIVEQVTALTSGGSLFGRLQIATDLASQATDQQQVIASLTAAARRGARTDGPAAIPMLEATQRLQKRLNANVNAKAAFEALALELS